MKENSQNFQNFQVGTESVLLSVGTENINTLVKPAVTENANKPTY